MTIQRHRGGMVAFVMLPVMAMSNPLFGLAMSVVLPALSGARENAKRTVCLTNLNGMGKVCMLYQISHNDQYPPDLETFIAEGIDPRLLECPSSPLPGPSYFYLAPAEGDQPDLVIACDYYWNHRGMRNVLFADGHIKSLEDKQFTKLLAQPVNARFAAALADAERVLARQHDLSPPPRY